MYTCPVCKEKLNIDMSKSAYGTLLCSNNHCFDKSKYGYVNLLLSDKMHSKTPGDNKLMVNARYDFLSKGFYKPFCDALKEETKLINPTTILDAGCGEGYYTSSLFSQNKKIYGVDISKSALQKAGKRNKSISYSISSLFSLPFKNECFDMLISLFAPYVHSEFTRVLKKNGTMILGIPDENHLFEIKELLYDKPYKNEVKDFKLEGFEFIKERNVKFIIHLEKNEDILNLLMMTPYYYRTPQEKIEKLKRINKLDVRAEFKILIYNRK